MIHAFKWLGTALQLTGCIIVALHLAWSGWAFPIMLAGSSIWTGMAWRAKDWPLFTQMSVFSATNVLGVFRWLG